MPQKTSKNSFWDGQGGKFIKGYGAWAIAYGIIAGAASLLLLLYLVTTMMNSIFSEISSLAFVVIVYYIFTIVVAGIFLRYGYVMRATHPSSSRMSGISTAILLLIAAKLIFILIIMSQAPASTAESGVLGILDLAMTVDSIRYKSKWYKSQILEENNRGAKGRKTESAESAARDAGSSTLNRGLLVALVVAVIIFIFSIIIVSHSVIIGH